MKGIMVNRLGSAEVLEYTDIPDPVPEPHQVLIEMRGASVNFADIKARSGGYHLGRKPPFIPGIDIAGVVVAVGMAVRDIAVGSRVIAFPAEGSYAELAVADEAMTFTIPDSVDFTAAAATPIVAGTAMHMLTAIAAIAVGERLLIHAAAGGVGSTALQIARSLGLTEVYASVGSPWKAERAKAMGAAAVVDYRADDYAEQIGRLTGGAGIDVILNPLGAATIAQDLRCLAPFGRLISFGNLGGSPATLPAEQLFPTNRAVIGFSFGHCRRSRPAVVRESMTRVIDVLARGGLDIPIDRCLPLSEAAAAHRCLEDRQAVGKLVLVPA